MKTFIPLKILVIEENDRLRLDLASKLNEQTIPPGTEIIVLFAKKGDVGESPGLATLAEVEKQHIVDVLRVESNLEKAAEILGITTVTLWKKRKIYGLP